MVTHPVDCTKQYSMTDASTDTPHQSRSERRAIREALLGAALPLAAFDGWSRTTFDAAAREAGISADNALLACPRSELDLVIFWSHQMDEQAARAIRDTDIAKMRVRERVAFCLTARLEAIGEHEEAARRARARLLLPDAASEGPQLVWRSCDTVWRAIGDHSTDFNFYTKRAILSGVYTGTLSLWLQDDSADKSRAKQFLDDRIENIMQYEKTKWKWREFTSKMPDLAGLLGKMRHGSGPGS